MTRRVLVTGAAGQLGQVLRHRLAQHLSAKHAALGSWRLRWSDRSEMTPLSPQEESEGHDLVRCDLTDAAAVNALLDGVDAVVHLGGQSVEADWDALLKANFLGLINLYEAARQRGTDRVLFASSNHAIGLYRREQCLDHTSSPRPDSRYGVSKAFGEDLAWLYAHKHRVRGFCMRIGSCTAEPRNARMLSTWLSHDDLLRLVATGLVADYRHEIVYGVSANRDSWWDNSRAYALGYSPKDDASAWDQALGGITSDNPITEAFQGGNFAAVEFEGDPHSVA
jgi:uronate dehydrogenase